MNDIRLIVGLGNPGPRYERTRHNAGFLVVERLRVASQGLWVPAGAGESAREEASVRLHSCELLLARPLRYMNRSGEPVRDLLTARGIPLESMLVVVDDTALPPGRLRFRMEGGAGGHRGLSSIEESIGTSAYPRLRVGIGEPGEGIDKADFVLEPLESDAWTGLDSATAAAAEAIGVAVVRGLRAAMDAFNRETVSLPQPPSPASAPSDGLPPAPTGPA